MVLSDSVSVATSKLSTIQKLKELSEFLGEYRKCLLNHWDYDWVLVWLWLSHCEIGRELQSLAMQGKELLTWTSL